MRGLLRAVRLMICMLRLHVLADPLLHLQRYVAVLRRAPEARDARRARVLARIHHGVERAERGHDPLVPESPVVVVADRVAVDDREILRHPPARAPPRASRSGPTGRPARPRAAAGRPPRRSYTPVRAARPSRSRRPRRASNCRRYRPRPGSAAAAPPERRCASGSAASGVPDRAGRGRAARRSSSSAGALHRACSSAASRRRPLCHAISRRRPPGTASGRRGRRCPRRQRRTARSPPAARAPAGGCERAQPSLAGPSSGAVESSGASSARPSRRTPAPRPQPAAAISPITSG